MPSQNRPHKHPKPLSNKSNLCLDKRNAEVVLKSIPAKAWPSSQLGCEMCSVESELAWRTGPRGKRLLCPSCGETWAQTPAKTLNTYDMDDSDSSSDADNAESAFVGLSLPDPPRHWNTSRSFLAIRKRRKIRVTSRKANPAQSFTVLTSLASEDPSAQFLNHLNPGLGGIAQFLSEHAVKLPDDLARMKPEWWGEFFRDFIYGKGLLPFDEYMLQKKVHSYLESKSPSEAKGDEDGSDIEVL